MKNLVSLYLSPRGRIPRSVFWLYGVLPLAALGFGLAGYQQLFGRVPMGVLLAPGLLVWWAQAVLVAKRLQDVNISGWWVLLLVLVPFAVRFAGYPEHQITVELVELGLVLCLGLIPGTKGSNRFGPDPLASE